MTKDAITEEIMGSPHYSHQWNNYDVRSDEAKSLLSRLGLVVDGHGEYVCDALLGFIADDSGYRSRNLDYAKETKAKIAKAKKIIEESKNLGKKTAMSYSDFCEKWKKENRKA